MSIARSLILRAAESQWLAGQMSRRSFSRRAIRRFMPGEELADAIGAAATLQGQGMGSLFTRLGEGLTKQADADAVRDHYLDVFDQLAARKLTTWISIKPTQLGLDLSADKCLKYLDTLAAKAVSTGSSLWIDMEDSTYVDRTLGLYRELKAKYEPVGLAIQSYLFRTPKDIEGLLPLKPWIRLVKGAYAEPAAIAFPVKRDNDWAFYDLSLKMLEGVKTYGGLAVFGTHDITLLQRIVASAKERGVKPGQYEIHMLYGIQTAAQRDFVAQGEAVKVLISYGHAWFKWYMRRLAERPANVMFVLKSLVG
ncbi:MAG: proline dehydrogenase [Gemmatimonadetes bacterium]|nr:proline dehydrogenase [Gemmatimonadota bacterium]